MATPVTLEVCGQLFPVLPSTIRNGPSSRLTNLLKTGISQEKSERIVINRPADSFAAILALYQTGELHIPVTSCPGAFLNELEYWEISPEVLSGCCYQRLERFLDEQETVRAFRVKQKKAVHKLLRTKSHNCLQKCRANIWEIIDYTTPSLVGKIYLLFSITMILASIFALAYSTDPIFRRSMTNCERLEYMVATGEEGLERIKPFLQALCSESDIPKFTPELAQRLNRTDFFHLLLDIDGLQDEDFLTFEFIKSRIVQSEFDNQIAAKSSDNVLIEPIERPFNITVRKNNFSESIILEQNNTDTTVRNLTDNKIANFSKASSVNNSNTNNLLGSQKVQPLKALLSHSLDLEITRVTVPNMRTKIFTLAIFEAVTTLFFSVELLLRLYSCPNLKLYFLSVINCSDVLSLIGTYLYFALYMIYPHLRYDSWIDYMEYTQMLRSLRLFRVVLNIRAGKVLLHSLRENIKDLLILAFFLFAGVSIFASCIYIVEDNPNITSIPDAWYLSVITMTTVGYGDIHPQTKIGRLVCCICAVVGVILLALTVPIFANHFLILYSHSETEGVIEKYLKEKAKERQKSQREVMEKNEAKTV